MTVITKQDFIDSIADRDVLAFTRALAVDLAGTNICVNALAPSLIASPLNMDFAQDPTVGPQWAKEIVTGK